VRRKPVERAGTAERPLPHRLPQFEGINSGLYTRRECLRQGTLQHIPCAIVHELSHYADF
jgi:hypothetical protein